MKYTVTFDRIGRKRNIDPLTINADTTLSSAELEHKIQHYARSYLMSRGVEIVVNRDERRGWITAGFHDAGTFTFEEVPQ